MNSLINHYKIRIQHLDIRNRIPGRNQDKLAYYEEKEKLTKNLERYTENLVKLKKKHQIED